MSDESKRKWAARAEKVLKGRTITGVRWMEQGEMESLGWFRSAPVLMLDDGNLIYPSMDDEGNDAGALYLNCDELPILPVI